MKAVADVKLGQVWRDGPWALSERDWEVTALTRTGGVHAVSGGFQYRGSLHGCLKHMTLVQDVPSQEA